MYVREEVYINHLRKRLDAKCPDLVDSILFVDVEVKSQDHYS